MIRKALEHRRADIILASKCACEVDKEWPVHGCEYTGENVKAGVEQSLRRLRTSYLDVVQIHGNPPRKELEEGGVIDALLELQRQGVVRCLGISSRLPLLAEFLDVDYFTVIQVPYSAPQRQNEDVISALRLHGMRFETRRQAMDEVIEWLRFYNSRRLHSTLGYRSPIAFEKKWLGEKRKLFA